MELHRQPQPLPKPQKKAARLPLAEGINPRLDLAGCIPYAGNQRERDRAEAAVKAEVAFYDMVEPKANGAFSPKAAYRLYRYAFGKGDEAVSWHSIKKDLERMKNGHVDRTFHVVVGCSRGDVVAYDQFNVLPLPEERSVVFLEYCAVADRVFMEKMYGRNENFRRTGIASALYVLRHGIAAQDSPGLGHANGVAGTMLEAEFIGQAKTLDEIRFTLSRLKAHARMGARAVMLDMGEGRLLSPHIQPALRPKTRPVVLHLLFRPLRFEQARGSETEMMDAGFAHALVRAYFAALPKPAFNRQEAEGGWAEVDGLFGRAKGVLLIPPERLPDMAALARMDPRLRRQVERDFGPLDAHEARIKAAFDRAPDAAGAKKE